MGKSEDRLLSTKEVMEILGIGWGTVYSFISEGKLKAHKLGGNHKSKRHWRVWHSDLLVFINNNEEGGKTHTESNKKKSDLSSLSPSPKEKK